jgi:KAP family P-loop domain
MSDVPGSNDNVGRPPSKAARPAIKSAPRATRAEPESDTVSDAIVEQFGTALGDMSANLAAVAADCARFANPDNGELVVDIQAVLSAMLAARQSAGQPTAVQWLQEWSKEQQLLFVMRPPPPTQGLRPVLSKTLRNYVLPRAIMLRDFTMGNTAEPVSLRHLLFALTESSLARWPQTVEARFVTQAQLADLRIKIVDRTGRSRRNGEDMELWQSLLTKDTPPGSWAAPATRPPTEATPLLSDNPATIDTLGRQPLAEALATRLVRLQAQEARSVDPNAMMIHLHGAWGSGKSSMVRILKATLAAQEPGWLVVDFNAWRNARVKPPWWNMLTEFKREISRRYLKEAKLIRWIVFDPSLFRWARLQLRWLWYSPTVDNFVPVASVLAVMLLLLAGGQLEPVLAALNIGTGSETVQWLKDLPNQLTLATGLIAALVAVVRGVLLGGKHVTESFNALRTDSFRPFITLFDMLVKASPAPVLIVLDDLDRCDAVTVTDLLEGIQTLFRGKPVVFLAVADRHWITTSFAERFKLFEGGDRARPVGDQFLDKMFQLSIPVPRIGRDVQTRYLKELLGIAPAAPPEAASVDFAPDDIDHDKIMARIALAPKAQRPRLRAQAVQRMATPAAEQQLTHRLEDFVEYMEANPRAIKRLINAVGLTQARVVLEWRTVAFDDIVRWTILELRWPHIAAWIENGWDSPASPARHPAGLKIGLDLMPDRPDFVEAAMAETDFAALTATLRSSALANLLMAPPYDAEEA